MPCPCLAAAGSPLRRSGPAFLSGLLSGAVVAALVVRAAWSSQLVAWLLLVLITLALLPLGAAQRRMQREGRLTPTTLPRPAAYRSAALQWLFMGALALWVAYGNAAPFDGSAFAWPDGIAGLTAWAVVAVIIVALLRWGRGMEHDRRRRAWLRRMYRHGASLIAPSTMWLAAALSALLFGVAHAWQGAWAIAWTTAFGLVAAALTLGSGSVWPAVAMHIGWNLITGDMMRTVYGGHQRRGASCRGGAATS